MKILWHTKDEKPELGKAILVKYLEHKNTYGVMLSERLKEETELWRLHHSENYEWLYLEELG